MKSLMMAKKLAFDSRIVAIVYLILLTLLNIKLDLLFLIGGLAGIWALEILDKIAWAYVTHPESPSSTFFRKELQTLNYQIFIKPWEEYSSSNEHTLKSMFFHSVLLILTFYVVLTGQNSFFIGFLLVINLIILMEQFKEFRKHGKLLNWSYLTNIFPNREESLLYLAGAGLIFIFLSLQY